MHSALTDENECLRCLIHVSSEKYDIPSFRSFFMKGSHYDCRVQKHVSAS